MSHPDTTVVPLATHPRFYQEGDLERLEAHFHDLREGAAITELHHLDTDIIPHGILHRYGFVTAAGYAYSGNVIIPKKPTSDIPVFNTHAWFTSPRGHNEHTGRKLAEDGLVNISVGNEGSYRPDQPTLPRQATSLGLASAAALSFSQRIAPEFTYLMDPHKRTAIGESKGGMEGMAHLVLADLFDQDILMADYTAACIPRKLNAADAQEFIKQIIQEPLAMARLGGRLAVGLAMHYPATVDLHPEGMAHQLAKGFAVFSGEAGDWARLVPTDKIVHLTTFTHDFASMGSDWAAIFSGHSQVRITPLEGHHLTIADPETLAYIRARQRAFRDELDHQAGDITAVDGQAIFDIAHQYVDRYRAPEPHGFINKAARMVFGAYQRAS